MRSKFGGCKKGPMAKTKYYPAIPIDASIDEIIERLKELLQYGNPGDKIRVKEFPMLFFIKVPANSMHPACVLPCIGYLYKTSRIYIRSLHNWKRHEEAFTNPQGSKFIEAFTKLFPDFKDMDDESNPSRQMLAYRNLGF